MRNRFASSFRTFIETNFIVVRGCSTHSFDRISIHSLPRLDLLNTSALFIALGCGAFGSNRVFIDHTLFYYYFYLFTHTDLYVTRTHTEGDGVLALTTCRLGAFFVFSIRFQYIQTAELNWAHFMPHNFKLHVICFVLLCSRRFSFHSLDFSVEQCNTVLVVKLSRSNNNNNSNLKAIIDVTTN